MASSPPTDQCKFESIHSENKETVANLQESVITFQPKIFMLFRILMNELTWILQPNIVRTHTSVRDEM